TRRIWSIFGHASAQWPRARSTCCGTSLASRRWKPATPLARAGTEDRNGRRANKALLAHECDLYGDDGFACLRMGLDGPDLHLPVAGTCQFHPGRLVGPLHMQVERLALAIAAQIGRTARGADIGAAIGIAFRLQTRGKRPRKDQQAGALAV